LPQAQGQRAEAIEVFRRCRQMLSVTLGVAPTGETEASLGSCSRRKSIRRHRRSLPARPVVPPLLPQTKSAIRR
jgi:DNA-binding SARP family transcriptional activator